ncbi:LacI family DNA-binding transcriptional regulator [Paenalkalicoccus suaedae]|uniref:LacI family DNA-binding transcriptional regulator n=1 Tax=Paenalkalicoccus suaedae TaxID=2592382 RepID=A0A859FI63_9BACI|nr:LacI family DNA-binding transcriptional regulator [Paenalkalicoccus suaedae]QKS72374.1 LacI family DNA-binding transcriptional regulator [Paenalkalicoccus suaedae]
MPMTIKEIAKLAGVSQATVSKIINNYDDVGAKTKERVLAIMEEHGYRPSYAAQTLARKETKLIGVIYAGKINVDFNHPFFVDVVDMFKKTIGGEGYDLLFFSNEKFHTKNENYLARCQHYKVDGCIIIGGEEVEPSVHDLDKSSIPCIGVDIDLQGDNSAYITTDNRTIASLAVEHFYLLGKTEIGMIGGLSKNLVSYNRLQGFREAMHTYRLPVNEEWIKYGDFFEESGYRSMKEWLTSGDYPTSIFAASDLMAFGVIRAIREHGLSTDDFAIIGVDDIMAARYSMPALTTVKQDKEKIGKMAAYLLRDMIQGKLDKTKVIVEPELIIRDSAKA